MTGETMEYYLGQTRKAQDNSLKAYNKFGIVGDRLALQNIEAAREPYRVAMN